MLRHLPLPLGHLRNICCRRCRSSSSSMDNPSGMNNTHCWEDHCHLPFLQGLSHAARLGRGLHHRQALASH